VRIGVFYRPAYYARFYETALEELVRRRHQLVLARPEDDRETKLPARLRGNPRVESASHPSARADGLDDTIRTIRLARDMTRFLTPELGGAHANRRRAFERLANAVSADSRPTDVDVLPERLTEPEQTRLARIFADIDSLVPPDDGLCRFIRERRLDVVVGISRVNLGGPAVDLARAARAVGVPSGMVVYSWDNLTNKGLLHDVPDRLFVWNDVQVEEAEALHGIDRARVAVTGAPRFDEFFARSPSGPRDALLSELGLDPSRRTLLYLGSSAFVAPREPEFVEDWAQAIRGSGDPLLENANLLIRPHPGTLKETSAWNDWRPSSTAIAVAADVRRDRAQDLYDQLFVADAVVGLNTSAEIEAAILDKPVLTVMAGAAVAPGQEGSVHFRYLLADHGGPVETADSLAQHVAQLRKALAEDPLAEARRHFVSEFVRPRGLDRPAGAVLADEIEALGRMRHRRRLPKLR
jgi:hypothetical protein